MKIAKFETVKANPDFSNIVDKREVQLFVGFYAISTIIYYIATWISYSTFEIGYLPFFALEAFFANAGTQFIISFWVTIPIWYITTILIKGYSLRVRLSTHIFFLPLYVTICYFSQLWITNVFGWVMFWGGYKVVWTLYNLMLFYLVQFAFIHAYTYFKKLKKEELDKAELREIALKSEMIALKAQLNPHFLHNLFNSINATIPPKNEQTREMIVQLSDLFRYQNYASQQEYVTIKEEVDFIENYLCLMKVRLKDRLNYHFEISTELHGFKISPMLLQPLVENAVNHGISSKIEPSFLTIKITKESSKVVFSIEDSGIGIPDKIAAMSKGIGLTNTKMRLAKIYQSDLKIEDNVPNGTKISFTI